MVLLLCLITIWLIETPCWNMNKKVNFNASSWRYHLWHVFLYRYFFQIIFTIGGLMPKSTRLIINFSIQHVDARKFIFYPMEMPNFDNKIEKDVPISTTYYTCKIQDITKSNSKKSC